MRAESVRVARPLFQEEGSGSTPTSAIDLYFDTISLDRAIELNMAWHSRLPVVSKSNIIRTVRHVCYSAEFGGIYYAIAIWTNPVARLLPQDTWLELRRLAVADDSPRNSATRMIGWMIRDIRKRFPVIERLVSYQDTEVHCGTIYKASGWVATTINNDGNWNRPNRQRNKAQSSSAKQRWEFSLR